MQRNGVLASQLAIGKSEPMVRLEHPSRPPPILRLAKLGLEVRVGENPPEATVSHMFIQTESRLIQQQDQP